MIKESWQSAIPNFDKYDAVLAECEHLSPITLLDIQPRLESSLIRFAQLKQHSRILLINSPDNLIYHQAMASCFEQLKTRQVIDNHCPIVRSETLEAEELFGQYQVINGEISITRPGLLHHADGGYLLISSNLILANPRIWSKLKSAILGENSSPLSSDQRNISQTQPQQKFDVKLVIIGDRIQQGDLDLFDSDIRSHLCFFSEVELDIKLNEQTFQHYLCYIKGLADHYQLPQLANRDAYIALLIQGARATEDQERMPLCPIWHQALLAEAAIESNHTPIKAHHIQSAIDHRIYRESYLPTRAIDDILEGQVVIEAQGERIGQVNGLTVIEIPGHPVTYGEPARISCVIHFGDGDISDVERKAELGGNLHAKGMMIMQAFLSSALNLDEALPFTASIVFEQSYSEVDGDSASLAELCSLVSALSEVPINQQIAVTGAVDQFGRVQAVGGLNEKIEGFFHVCQHQGLTGNQGVILPKTNLKHLSLQRDVVEALKHQQFHLWSVESVDEALPILMSMAFRGDEEETILNKISDRIEMIDKSIDDGPNWYYVLKNKLFGH